MRNFFPAFGFASMTASAYPRLIKLNKVNRKQELKRRRNPMKNRPLLKRVFFQALAWTALSLLSGGVALAQETAPEPPAATAPAPPPATTARTDGEIEMDVVHALDAATALKNDLITAATIQSEVTLSGTVSSDASRSLAEAIASQVQGVTKVNNNLTVGNPQASSNPDTQVTADQSSADGGNPSADQGASAMNGGPMQVPNETPAQAQMRAQIRAEVQVQAQRQAQQQSGGPVTLPEGMLIQLRTSEPVSSRRAMDGTPVDFVVIQDVTYNGILAIPRGAVVHGVVNEVKKAGALKGAPELALTLTSLDLGGRNYPVETDQFMVKGPGKGGHTVGNVISGSLVGTMIGCAFSRWGCLVGAGAGAAAGTAASAATPGPNAWIPSEARVDFRLDKPLTVMPVSSQEAARLAQGLYPGGPTLHRRVNYGPYYGPYGSPYPYAYPPVFFHPYYMVGGYYYWR
jgi:hypothetical protein